MPINEYLTHATTVEIPTVAWQQATNLTFSSTLSHEDLYAQAATYNPRTVREELLKQHKAEIKADMKKLIATGISDRLTLRTKGTRLIVSESGIGGGGTIFFMIHRRKMQVNKKATSYMKAIIEKLAKREGLEIEYVNSLDYPSGQLKYVAYWSWKHPEEVDDSELMGFASVKSNVKKKQSLSDALFNLSSLSGVPF